MRKVFAEGSAEGFFLPMLRIIFLGGGWFRGRFLRKVLRKVFAEGSAEGFCGRSLAEDLCGRFPEGFRKDSGRFWAFSSDLPHPEGFLQKVPRKVFAEGSAEGFFLTYAQNHTFFWWTVPRKVFAEGSAEGSRKVFRGRKKIQF